MAIRRQLHSMGFRYRVDTRPDKSVRRRADLVFPRERIAVFVDGCFWHVCPEHGTWPKANAGWWREKLLANERRDRQTDETLRSSGWTVLRIWEHEDYVAASQLIADAVGVARIEMTVSKRRHFEIHD